VTRNNFSSGILHSKTLKVQPKDIRSVRVFWVVGSINHFGRRGANRYPVLLRTDVQYRAIAFGFVLAHRGRKPSSSDHERNERAKKFL